jgi:ElaB/YqjD/DUF883 family membrane-anchored ribosome-binding protein
MRENKHTDYVNEEIDQLNNSITELYESMMDIEYDEVVSICSRLMQQLKEIQSNYTNETLL